jgi:DNA-binding transcriptional MerR regulator
MQNEYYKIEDVAKKTGLTKRAIRYYEDIELIKPIRSESSYRLYTEDDINKIIRVVALRDSLGFSLSEVKNVFDLEVDLINIFNGDKKDDDLVNKSVKLINHQLKIVEEKEQTLKDVKDKYLEILAKLETLNNVK